MKKCAIPDCKKPRSKRGVTCGPACAHLYRHGVRLNVTVKDEPELEQISVQEEHKLRRENSRLKKEIKDILSVQEKDATLYSFIKTMMDSPVAEPPAWTRERVSGIRQATPTAFLSDPHLGEKVFPEQIEWLNGYDREIAGDRLKRFFNNTCVIARDYLTGLSYPGIVLALGGDNFSGDIHEELAKTNEGTLQEEVLYWLDPMVSGIKQLADEFGKVFVPSVVGNHPRGTKKPAMKMRVPNNFDWLFACLLEKLLKHDSRITFMNTRSADLTYQVYDTRFRLTHGDQFKGGSGIAGVLSPLMIGDARKRKRAMKTRKEYDWLLVAHWHQRLKFKQILLNGSLKGYDEYSYMSSFDFENPEQSFFLTDPGHGVTIDAPIHVLGKNESWMNKQPRSRRIFEDAA